MTSECWYEEGLKFSCTECGKCCTGAPGYVWVTPEEIEAMAKALELSTSDFSRLYVRRIGQRYSLTEKAGYDCVFLKDGKCQVYKQRPKQCRTFPFWPQNLRSKEAWNQAAKECEGINDTAELIDLQTIKDRMENG